MIIGEFVLEHNAIESSNLIGSLFSFFYFSATCSYVLVRVSRFREKAKLLKPIRPNQLIEPDVLEKMRNVTVGDTTSALQFMQKYGTHYINSYTTGNSLYQVSCCCEVIFSIGTSPIIDSFVLFHCTIRFSSSTDATICI